MGGAVRRAVRDLLPTRAGHLGNAIPNWLIHGPEVNLGFAIPDPAKMIFLSAVRSAAKVLNLRRNEERAPTSPVNQCLVEEFVTYAGELEKSKKTNWAERVVPPLKISQDCPYPAVMMEKWALVLPLDILAFGPISSRRLAANRATSQWPWLLTALWVLRGKVALDLESGPSDPVLRGKVDFPEANPQVHCDFISVLMSRARRAINKLFQHEPTKYGADLARNTKIGMSCFLAPSLRNPAGQHLLTAARLGPVSGAINRLRAGSYIFRGKRNPSGRIGSKIRGISNPNRQFCNACGRSQPGTSISHVLGSPPSGNKGCPATRRLVSERHDRLATTLGHRMLKVYRGKHEDRRLGFEVPADSNLRLFRKGQSRKRADAVVVSPLEAIVIEVSVTNSPFLAQKKLAQAAGYVASLGAATGIPASGWPLSVLWRKIGSNSWIVRMGFLNQKFITAMAWPLASRLVTRSSQPGLGAKVALKSQIAAVKRDVRKSTASRVIFLVPEGLEDRIRSAWGTSETVEFAVLIDGKPFSRSGVILENRTLVGPTARSTADLVNLRWPINLGQQLSPPGPLRLRLAIGVFDVIGTAFPITVRSLMPFLERKGIQDLGSSVLREYPAFIRAWKGTTRANIKRRLVRRGPSASVRRQVPA